MTIKQQGGVFGRNPTFNDVNIDKLTVDGSASVNGPLDCDGFTSNGQSNFVGTLGTVFVDSQGAFLNFTRNSGNYIRTTGASSSLYINTALTNRIGILNTGDVLFYKDDGTTVGATWDASAGNLAFASGNGIDFSATSGTGTGTSELFDDYEEGTWTATVGCTGNATTTTTVTAYYTKIGRQVTVSLRDLNDIDTTGLSGFIQVSLPFTCITASVGFIGALIWDSLTYPAGYDLVFPYVANGGSAMAFAIGGSGIADSLLDVSAVTSGTTDLKYATLTYFTA